MTVPSLTLPALRRPSSAPARAWLREHSFGVRLTVALLLVAAAYPFSLLTLVRALGLETPLAYLGLVPVLALGIGLVKAVPKPDEPTIHDRQVDIIVGVPLLATALGMNLLLPGRLDTLYWLWRIDLLSLPLFTAGVVALVFGVRALWRLRAAFGFLLLAWPLPWTALLARWLDGFTDLTVASLKQVLQLVPVATPSAGSDGSLFAIQHGGSAFVVSVASACSGVNGVVGFLLVGVVASLLTRGGRLRKIAWLASGMALIWALNIARLLLIFWGGERFGERVAIDGLHPVIGLVLFCAGIGVMAVAMPWFGLLPQDRFPQDRSAAPTQRVPHHRLAVPRVRSAVVVLTVLATTMGVANAGVRDYQQFAGDLGTPRLATFASGAVVPGYDGASTDSYPWAQRFFGASSSWVRYSYRPTLGAVSGQPLTVDVVDTASLSRLRDYGIQSCYAFHGYQPTSPRDVELGGGVTGSLLSYTDPDRGTRWDVLHWVWPVASPDGSQRYERVAVLVPGDAGNEVSAATGPAALTSPDSPRSGGRAQSAAAGPGTAGADALTRFARAAVLARPDAASLPTPGSAGSTLPAPAAAAVPRTGSGATPPR